MLDKSSKIYVAGHRGLVGSAIWNNLKSRGYNNLVGITLYKYKDIQLCTIAVHSDSDVDLFCEKVLSILTYKED